MSTYILSKSSFIKGLQCEKQLYLYKHHYDLRDTVTPNQQAVFSKGWSVGDLARNLFPGGIDVSPASHKEYDESVQTTGAALSSSKVIYEGAFIYDDIYVANDILVKENGKWKAYEVKSSTSVSETHILDASIQYYVLVNSGIDLSDFSIIYINNQYLRDGALELTKLFSIQSVLNEVKENREFVRKEAVRLKELLRQNSIPGNSISTKCHSPYDCSFLNYCWQTVPENSVFDLCGMRSKNKFELYNSGIVKLTDLPADADLSEAQQIQVECFKNNSRHINKKEIKKFFRSLNYPLYFMDFETINPAIPLYNNSKPYQQIPFQYSVHLLRKKDSPPLHYEFLAAAGKDSRKDFIEALLPVLDKEGDIIVCNQTFEITRLKEIAEEFPEYKKKICNVIDRIKDLMVIFRSKDFYDPAFSGSYSIKAVLPVLVPGLSYKELQIGDGGTASLAFENLQFETDDEKINQTRNQLLEYCKLDSLAMVKILAHLRGALS